jgi:DNA-binding LacI/PurR family transcriptional regulator
MADDAAVSHDDPAHPVMRAGRVTLNDVAAASGVSRATASVVLRDSRDIAISESTRERVRQAARDLGYVPHGIARALREGSSRIVVLMIDANLDGHFARSYIGGLDGELAAHDHVLLVRYGLSTREAMTPTLEAIAPRAVLRFADAYLAGPAPAHADGAAARGRPPGSSPHWLEDSGGGWRDGLAAHVALQFGYLAERGHECIAVALPDRLTALAEARVHFAAEVAAWLRLASPPRFPVPRDRASATAAVRELRAAQPDVTAIAAHDDDVALRVLAAAADLGVAVPGDLAVIGHDETEYGALSTPALTTIRVDAEGYGRRAARTLLGLDPGDLSPAPAQVVARQSA